MCVCNKPRYFGWVGVLLSIHFLAITGLMVILYVCVDLLLFFGVPYPT